jgi:hypothetical protein
MIKESLEALAEPEKAQSLGATKVLVALIRSSRMCHIQDQEKG